MSATTEEQLAVLARSHAAMQALLAAQASVLTALVAQRDAAPQQQQQQRARIAADPAPALERDEVLDGVLEYVGIGDYICSGAVNRRWKGRYIKLC
jgi:hypothetical protein